MMEIMDKDSSCYSLISLDLNNLKLVNDTQGHAAGDRLIQTFAKVLDDVFGKRGTVGRMGGDEFLVILPDITEKEQQPLIDELLAKINQTNRDIPELHLSTAYGFCAKTENPNWNVNEIYHEADSRMYENKIKSGNHR
jgi:diguanylate cyclase (GGDEF)-like protein